MTDYSAIRESVRDRVARLELEQRENWVEELNNIPFLEFCQYWEVQIIPPFSGACVRFRVRYNGNEVSVYLDTTGSLGYYDGNLDNPTAYWEIHPYEEDTMRYHINDTEGLLVGIHRVLLNMYHLEIDDVYAFIDELYDADDPRTLNDLLEDQEGQWSNPPEDVEDVEPVKLNQKRKVRIRKNESQDKTG